MALRSLALRRCEYRVDLTADATAVRDREAPGSNPGPPTRGIAPCREPRAQVDSRFPTSKKGPGYDVGAWHSFAKCARLAFNVLS